MCVKENIEKAGRRVDRGARLGHASSNGLRLEVEIHDREDRQPEDVTAVCDDVDQPDLKSLEVLRVVHERDLQTPEVLGLR